VLSQGVTRPAQAKHDGPQLPNQATRRSVRFMQANLDVIGPEMAMGDPVRFLVRLLMAHQRLQTSPRHYPPR
jgi:hypothetical protein